MIEEKCCETIQNVMAFLISITNNERKYFFGGKQTFCKFLGNV
jgi:hypothetical protein